MRPRINKISRPDTKRVNQPLCYCCQHGATKGDFRHCECPDLNGDLTAYFPGASITRNLNNLDSVKFALPVLTVVSGECPHYCEKKETPRQDKITA